MIVDGSMIDDIIEDLKLIKDLYKLGEVTPEDFFQFVEVMTEQIRKILEIRSKLENS